MHHELLLAAANKRRIKRLRESHSVRKAGFKRAKQALSQSLDGIK